MTATIIDGKRIADRIKQAVKWIGKKIVSSTWWIVSVVIVWHYGKTLNLLDWEVKK